MAVCQTTLVPPLLLDGIHFFHPWSKKQIGVSKPSGSYVGSKLRTMVGNWLLWGENCERAKRQRAEALSKTLVLFYVTYWTTLIIQQPEIAHHLNAAILGPTATRIGALSILYED